MTTTTVPTYCFEVVPVEAGRFDPMLLDVPSLSGEAFAARRAYWTAFHMLGARGIDVDEFAVFEYDEAAGRGRLVTSGGFAQC